MAPWVARPRSVCVVIGPFIGWKVVVGGMAVVADGCVLVVTTSSGLPRSQARLSRSPNTWQLEQEASPLPEVRAASYRNGRPVTTEAGSGVYSGYTRSGDVAG